MSSKIVLLLALVQISQTFALTRYANVKDTPSWKVVLYSPPHTTTSNEYFTDNSGSANSRLASLMGVNEADAAELLKTGEGLDRAGYPSPCEQYPTCSFERSLGEKVVGAADVVIYPWFLKEDLLLRMNNLSSEQTSVLYWREAIPHVPEDVQRLAQIRMGVHHDSDIANPRMTWSPKDAELCSKSWAYVPPANRSKFAVAITSECSGERMDYLTKLAKLIPLDIYGDCTGNRLTEDDEPKTLAQYKFFISLENTFVSGYATEKLMRGLPYGVVPVYLGDPCVKSLSARFDTKDWFIDARDFDSQSDLADHLLSLDGTKEYDSLLAWRRASPDESLDPGPKLKRSGPPECQDMDHPPSYGAKARHEAFCQLCDPSFVRSTARTGKKPRPDALNFESASVRFIGGEPC